MLYKFILYEKETKLHNLDDFYVQIFILANELNLAHNVLKYVLKALFHVRTHSQIGQNSQRKQIEKKSLPLYD